MEAGEENGGNFSLKRQRAPLSDSEDNVLSQSEMSDGQKRRRLEAAGQENRSPKPSSSGRHAELETKPDTPMVPSVRSRVQQLTQRREGAAPLAQRCLSDPGADSPSVIILKKGFREHLLGEGEFNQRMERFKVPVFQASPNPTPSPANPSPRSCSNFVSAIQQKLHGTTAPSSKLASRIRQEREEELSQLPFQPISENAWLKRSSSDPSLPQRWTPPGPASFSSWVPRCRGRFHWPPMHPWDKVDGDTDLNDGSFEAPTSGAEKQSSDGAGQRAPGDSAAPDASAELCMEHKASAGNDDKQLGTQKPQTQTVLKLSFSEDQSFSKVSLGEDHNVSELPTGEEQSLLESTHLEESNMKGTAEVSTFTEQGVSEVFLFEETDGSLYSEEGIEPSTDEESRSWRYPQDKVCEEESVIVADQGGDLCVKEEERELESSRVEKQKRGSCADHSETSGECYLGNVSAEIAGSETQGDEKAQEDEGELDSCLDYSVKDQSDLNKDQGKMESCEGFYEGAVTEDIYIFATKQDQKDTGGCSYNDDMCQQSNAVNTKKVDMDLESDRRSPNSRPKQTDSSPSANVAQDLKETQTELTELEMTVEEKAEVESQAESSDTEAQSLTDIQLSDDLEIEKMEQDPVDERKGVVGGLAEETCKAEGGEGLKKVTFILEPELINDPTLPEDNTSTESRAETSMSDAELNSHDETNTAEIIDQMFEEVLEYAGRIEEERGDDEDTEDRDSGIGVCSGDKEKMDTESEKEKSEEEGESKEEGSDESKMLESNRDELLTFPSSGILSPLSKSVEAVVTPLRLEVSQESNPPSLLLTPEETDTPLTESAPLYSIDAYRTQRQRKPPTIQSVTPGVQRRAPEKSKPQPSVNTKEKITALNEEAGKLQTVISQTLQALSCCTDEEHGRGSLEEAEAEKLLLVSCEKRSALLAEVARLREERSSESGEAGGEDREFVSQQACRGTVSITNIQLPLKVEFVCSSHNRTGRPSHYFFVLIRYGPCNIVATPLATAADAQNGDTISFPTSVTLKDIRSSFEIDVEVYSLSHTSGSNCSMDRITSKSRVTPRKLLNTITRSSHSLTSAAPPGLNTRRSSNFCLVGSHKITLASLGHSKFPLDKMKLEGKIRRLLGDEFQEKVPFLSPLEGNIYLHLDSESHSNVQHQGFLTMFELISGYGVWHRRYFVLEECNMHYWNHPNDKETKEAEGSISLSSSHSRCVRPVKRDSCARPFTFELVSNIPKQQDASQDALAKCWFSADTKQERLDWMEKLNQALLDFHTWNRTSAAQTESQQSNSSSGGNLRESIL
ncbi:anillin isoform X2 [Plectropomus leopardus]|uniref:anillin isoform X2 n=1 Tax=Plectropomus leopardus TaxID=160734 RepID=UPI001C4B6D86|nr:anillin isoform X2 [Plectropomus leopardus]